MTVNAKVMPQVTPRTVAVVAPYYPPKVGGVENYAAQVARAIADAPDLRPVVITTGATRLRTRVATEDGVLVVRLGTWLRLSNTPLSPLWPLQLRRWLRRTGAEVVNAHAPVPGLPDLAVLLAGRRPTVLTYHAGSMHKGEPGSGLADRLIGLYERRVLPRVFSRAARLVAVSPVSLASGQPHCEEISPGVDLARFTPGGPASARPRSVVYLGRMDRSSAWKGVDVLVRAFAEVAAELPEARLRLVGGGDAVADHVELAKRLGVADRVEATGELTGDRLAEALRGAAVLVLPSRSEAESFGMVLVEAMACGTPVVGSAVGGIPCVVTDGENGLLVPAGDVAALATACRTVLTDGALADRLAARGLEVARKRYSWPVLTDRYVELFRSS
ncbi:glycosyltransferase family 4 protein [Streptacidiphilus fuscans]|uniref:glycosyltransferase family 4 protein n=1 Tax=Streptacidiphilus fuscans TaxID=2789292 RepID=UPI0018ACB5DD|nr:glycosyltransferase family 4 protein [Streptacidiphilus fuscans]